MNFKSNFSSKALRTALEDIENSIEEDIVAGQNEADKRVPESDGVLSPEEYQAVMTAANEAFLENNDDKLIFGGALASLVSLICLGPFSIVTLGSLGILGAGAKHKVERLRNEIDAISEDIAKALTKEGKEAIAKGELTKDSYKEAAGIKNTNISKTSIFLTALGYSIPIVNLFVATVNNLKINSRFEELRRKQKELAKIIEEARNNPATENYYYGSTSIGGNTPRVRQLKKEIAIVRSKIRAALEGNGEEQVDESGNPIPESKGGVATAAVNQPPAGDAVGQQASGTGEGEGVPSNNESATGDVAQPTAADGAGSPEAAQPSENTGGDGMAAAGDAAASAAGADQTQAETDVAEGQALAEDIQEADKIGVAMESFHREMIQLSKAAAGLESLANIMMSSKQVGGPNPHGAMFYTAAVETICDMMTIAPPLSLGLEAMEEPDAKIEGADKQAKSAKNLAVRIYEAIKSGLSRFGGWIKNLWGLITSSTKRAHARVTSLLSTIDGMQEKKENVTGAVANVVKDTAEFVSVIPTLTPVVQQFNNPSTYHNYISLMNVGVGFMKGTAVQNLDQMPALMDQVSKDFSKNMQTTKEETLIVAKKPWVGKSELHIRLPLVPEAMGSFATTIASVEKDAAKVESVTPINKVQAKAVLQQLSQGLDNIIKTTDENGLKGVDSELNKAANEYKNTNPDKLVNEKGEESGRIMKLVSSIVGTRAKLPAYVINRAYVGAAVAAVNLISASMGKGQAEAKPAEAPAA